MGSAPTKVTVEVLVDLEANVRHLVARFPEGSSPSTATLLALEIQALEDTLLRAL
jgi:hypothetical protein